MSFELFVALRYLLARRKQAFISLISLISTIGVAVGVMALVIALALMTGLQGELRDRILGSTAHVYVWKTGGIEDYRTEVSKLREVPGVIGAGPAILGKALISSARADALWPSTRSVTLRAPCCLAVARAASISPRPTPWRRWLSPPDTPVLPKPTAATT